MHADSALPKAGPSKLLGFVKVVHLYLDCAQKRAALRTIIRKLITHRCKLFVVGCMLCFCSSVLIAAM